MAAHPQLIDIAGAVADLTEVDWDALEAGAAGTVEIAALKRLRLLDRIVRACASVAGADETITGRAGASPAEPAPATWGPFTLHEKVGRGSFGDVYRAHERRLDRIVALKLLRRQDTADTLASEVIEEGRLLARVRHPNVVTVYGAEQIDGRVGMWMEFVGGRTLAEELKANGPLPAKEVTAIGLTLCGALTAVHEAGLLHRDLKAQNVLRATDGRIILTDFGAGRAMASEADHGQPEMAGTPLYLAPEVVAGKPASVASEIYGLGVLLYHLATGSFPVRGRTLRELREAHAKGDRVSIRAYRDKLPKPLMSIIGRAVEPDPARRFSSVGDLRAALTGAGGRPRPWPLLGAAAVLLVFAVFTALRMQRPVLSVESQRIVSRPSATPDLAIQFVHANRVYYAEGDSLFSTGLGPADAPEPVVAKWQGFQIVDLDRSGSEFLVQGAQESNGDRQVWIASPATGQLRPAGTTKCGTATWSPDNTKIACVSEEKLSIVSTDGSTVTPMPAPSLGEVGGPHWSPDGRRLRFNVTTKDRDIITPTIWEILADGTGLHQILPGWSTPPGICCGAWTPDGEYYIFRAQSRDTGLNELWALREKRTLFDWALPGPIRLTTGPLSYDSLFISDDGRQLLSTAGQPRSEVVRLDLRSRQFAPYLGIAGTWFAFAPDRQAFAYIGYPVKRLWGATAPGFVPRQLIDAPVEVDGVAWSPDGKWLSFLSRLAGKYRRIFLSQPDGSNPQPIIQADDEQGIPSWSADSRQIAYGDVPVQFGIADGTERLHIYDLERRTITDVPGSEGLWTCRWSPDGRYLAALTLDKRMMLRVRDMKTGVWRSFPDANLINDPTWSHDSQYIYYDTEGGPRVLRRVRISDGHVEDLTSQQAYYFAAMWSGLAPDDSPLVAHNTGTVDMYALTLRRR